MWVKRKSHLLLLLSYMEYNIMIHSFFSLHLMLLFQNIISKIPPLLFLHHNRPCGQETSNPPQFCKNTLPFIYLHHFTNSTPINTPSPSLSLHFTSSSSLLPAASNREATKGELLLLLPLFTQTPSSPQLLHQTPLPFLLHHFVRPATPFGLGQCFFSGGKT